MTYGFLLGELIRRVDGRGPRQFFNEEIARKIGADFQLGLSSETEAARMAILTIPPGAFAADGPAGKLLTSIDLSEVLAGGMGLEWLSHEDPGGMGFGNGRSIARLCSIVANGGEVDGVRILSPQVIAQAGHEHAYAQCPYLGWLRLGLGFGLDSKEFPAPSPTTLQWGGAGGSWAFMDPKAAVSAGYAPNNWHFPPPDLTQISGEQDPVRAPSAAQADLHSPVRVR
jgi:CubicO group peptidase (beta-lactamase class C family)